MKKIHSILAVLIASFAIVTMANPLASPMPSGPQDTLMTDTPWVVFSAISDSLFYDSVSMEWISDILLAYEACDQDDLVKFNLDSTYFVSEGSSDCDSESSETTIHPYTWYFFADNDSLLLISYENDTTLADVVKLVSDTLRINYHEVIGTRTYTNTITYIPKDY